MSTRPRRGSAIVTSPAPRSRADLARYLDHDRVQAYREPWAESLLRLGRKYQVVIALVGAYLLMRVLVAWWTARG
jgi:hypothetical protein